MKFLAAVLFACVATLALLHSVYGTPVQPVPNPDANPVAVNPEAANPAPNPMAPMPNPADPVTDPAAPVPSPNPADPAPNPTAPVSSPVDKTDPKASKPDGNIEFRGAGAGVNNLAHVPLTGPVAGQSTLSNAYDDAIFVGNAVNPVGDAVANLEELNADAPAEQPAMIV